MNFEKILSLGVEKEIINENQKNCLIDLYYQNEQKQVPTVVKMFYYIGGLIVICAMTCLMSTTIQNSTYAVILTLGTIYALLFLGVGEFLWKKNEKVPAGILYFLFVVTFSLIVMTIEKMTGFFPHFSDMDKYPNYWGMCFFPVLLLSVLTIIANTVLQRFRQVDLLVVPTIFCSYATYLTFIDLIGGFDVDEYRVFYASNLIFATILTIIAFLKDRLTKVDYSKWLYFFGAVGIFWSQIALLCPSRLENWQSQLVFFILSLAYVFVGLMLERKSFSILGVLGIIEYIMFLELYIIKDSMALFTSAMIMTGLIILYSGVVYNQNSDKLRSFIKSKLPEKIRKHLPQDRA